MVSSGSVPPLAPDELVSTGGEREVLEAFLDLYRDIVRRKLTGLSDQQVRERHVRSATTLGGLVKHLAAVEREWFQLVLAGRSVELPPADGWTLDAGRHGAEPARRVRVSVRGLPAGRRGLLAGGWRSASAARQRP